MRYLITGFACVLATLTVVSAGQERAAPAGVYRDTTYGFSMNTPRFPAVASGKQSLVATFFSRSDGEPAADVKIIVHGEGIPLAEFLAFTEQEIHRNGGTMGPTSLGPVSGRDAAIFEFDIMETHKPLRCLGLAVADKDRVYLITGTAPKASFDRYEPVFREALESFKLDEGK